MIKIIVINIKIISTIFQKETNILPKTCFFSFLLTNKNKVLTPANINIFNIDDNCDNAIFIPFKDVILVKTLKKCDGSGIVVINQFTILNTIPITNDSNDIILVVFVGFKNNLNIKYIIVKIIAILCNQ